MFDARRKASGFGQQGADEGRSCASPPSLTRRPPRRTAPSPARALRHAHIAFGCGVGCASAHLSLDGRGRLLAAAREKPGEGGRMPRDWTGMMLPPSPVSLPAVVTKPDVPCRASIYRRACEARCPADRWVTKLTGYMGDSFSCFGVRRLPVPGDGQATQFLLVGIDPADRHVEEADLPLTRLGLRQGDGFADERLGDVDEAAL